MALRSQTVKNGTTDEHRVLDLDATRAVSIECDAYRRTDDGHALRFDGSEPLFVVGVYSERDARAQLAGAGYGHAAIDRAFSNGEWAEANKREHMTKAASVAERNESADVATDGGHDVESDDGVDAAAALDALDLQRGEQFVRGDDELSVSAVYDEWVEFAAYAADGTRETEEWTAGKLVHHLDAGRIQRTDDTAETDGGTTESDDEGREIVDVHPCSTCDGHAHGDDNQCDECQQRGVSPVDETPL